jgi:hypothetical protein
MFNTDHYFHIGFAKKRPNENWSTIFMCRTNEDEDIFVLSRDLSEEERLSRYYDLVDKLTGERIDG